MFVDVVTALDRLALDAVWCTVISTTGLLVHGELASPSWDGDGRLSVGVGWAGMRSPRRSTRPSSGPC